MNTPQPVSGHDAASDVWIYQIGGSVLQVEIVSADFEYHHMALSVFGLRPNK
jgi:hypothetical protein